MRFIIAIAIIITTIIFTLPHPTTQAQDALPHFEPSQCQFYTYDYNIECGYLIVPEDRGLPNSPTIRLHVAIIRSENRTPAEDPLLVLEGGPGAPLLEFSTYLSDILAPILEDRDIIMMDQRGVGFSEPNLSCPEYADQILRDLSEGAKLQKAFSGNLEGMLACQERLLNEGINVAAYNTHENAADIADLRLVLGYKKWNIYGVSYGTRLVMMVMREHPHGVRSVILDSSYPPMADYYGERFDNFTVAFDNLFTACETDSYCNRLYPNLETVFYSLVDRLNAEPVVIDSYDYVSDQSYDIVLSGDIVTWLSTSLLRTGGGVGILPSFIYQLHEENYEEMGYILTSVLNSTAGLSYGMHMSVQCSEAIPFTSYLPDTLNVEVAPQLGRYMETENTFIYKLCEQWQVREPNVGDSQPFSSEIPTMVMAGELDPTTPAKWGQLTADMLTNSHYFEYPATGHAVITSYDSCPVDMIRNFLNRPNLEPNAQCINQMPGLRFD